MLKKFVCVAVALMTGCASIVHQTTQQVPVKSEPAGATLTVACGDVYNDPKLVTPTVITVHRKPEICSVSLTKEGFKPAEVKLERAMSPWYLGNVLIGGIVGLIVDAVNGAMYDRKPKEVTVDLVPADTAAK